MSNLLDAILQQETCSIGGMTCTFNYQCCKGWSCIDRRAEKRPPCKNPKAKKCCKGSSWIGHLFGSSPSRIFSDRLFGSSPYHIFIDRLLGSSPHHICNDRLLGTILSHLMYFIAKFTSFVQSWKVFTWDTFHYNDFIFVLSELEWLHNRKYYKT